MGWFASVQPCCTDSVANSSIFPGGRWRLRAPPKDVNGYDRCVAVRRKEADAAEVCVAANSVGSAHSIAADRFADRVSRLKLMTTLSTCIPAQAGVADYPQHGGYDRHLRSLRSSLQSQLEQMETALHKWLPSTVRWVRPTGGYLLWLQLPQSVKAMELHGLASARGISIAPGPIFSATHGFQDCIRLNFGHPWDNRFENAVRALAQILDDPSIHG